MYKGQFFQVNELANTQNKILELVFDAASDPVNTLRTEALQDLEVAVAAIEKSDAEGLVIRSGKALFSAGADIKGFLALFSQPEKCEEYLTWVHSIYNRIEDLNFPKVAIINGTAAGGGVELTLLAEYRLATPDLKMSLPEVKLGIFPGWGGLTRMPRIQTQDTALSWLTSGKTFKAADALRDHAIDGIVNPAEVNPVEKAVEVINSAIAGDLDWQAKREIKRQPLKANDYELAMSFNVARGMVAKAAGPHYPAPMLIVNTIEKAARMTRDEALKLERAGIVECGQNGVADALVNVFLGDMAVKSKGRKLAKAADKTKEVGVIGAGIMGGGIAYVSADRGMDVVLKDINKAGLDLGLSEANKLLSKQVERRRKTPLAMGDTLNRITPTLLDDSLAGTDLIIEAVVENPVVKAKVLAQLEKNAPNAVIASNTSTLNITGLAESLEKPENFCGIHFFNPVHRMPLVEVIRGEKTSDETIAKAVQYVLQLGKAPIVVNDCAGFLVNRCLTPYFLAYNQLLVDGGDIAQIDKVMSRGFGWPMGPALLLDVIGLDTADHCIDVMDGAFPDRLAKPATNLIHHMTAKGQYGQKTKQGFYSYELDRRGRLKPAASADTQAMQAELCAETVKLEDNDILMRMMLPMMFEAIRCLDENIIASAQEGDIAFVYGTGFPPFRGGLFHYMDKMGLDKLLAEAKRFEHLGSLYQIPQGLVERVEQNRKFYA